MTPHHRRRLGAALVVVASLIPFFGAPSAGATTVAQKQAEARRLAGQLDAVGNRISVLDEQLNQAHLRVAQAQASLSAAADKVRVTDLRVATVAQRVASRAVESYVAGGGLSQAIQLMNGSGSQLPVRQQYLQVAAGTDRRALDDLRAAREDLVVQQSQLGSVRRQALSAAANVAARRRAALAILDQQQALLARVRGELSSLVQADQQRRAAADQRRAATLIASRQARSASSGGDVVTGVPSSSGAAAAVDMARQQIGKPYEYGAAGPDSFDCSGLTLYSWRAGGVSLPHSAGAQYGATTHIPLSDLEPGDLVFYGSPIHHVGIYVGSGTMIEASHAGVPVRYAGIYRSDLVGAGRP